MRAGSVIADTREEGVLPLIGAGKLQSCAATRFHTNAASHLRAKFIVSQIPDSRQMVGWLLKSRLYANYGKDESICIRYAHFHLGGNVSRGLLIAALLFSCVDFGSAEGQSAIVTFYSHGSFLTSGLPGTKHDIYVGSVFDGTQGMFSFLDSHIGHNNRYITLRFIPGPHTFGASNGKRPEARETLSVDLKAGQKYFIRAQGESKGVPGFTIQHGRLDLVPCTEAHADMATAKPLKEKALWKKTRSQLANMVVNETSPPPCE